MEKVFRQYVGKSSVNQDGTVKAVISTNTPDRYDDIVSPKGALLDNYRRNPVVLWNHNSNLPPIGKNINIMVYDNEIVALTKFADTQLAQEIKSLYEGGFMSAFSIGFIPKKSDIDSQGRTVFTEWELLEYSCVPIPANPEALTMALKNVQSPELKSILNQYKTMAQENIKIKEIEDKIEDLDLSFENIQNDLVGLEENAILVERALEDFEAIKAENANLKQLIENLSETVNSKLKENEKELLKSLIKDLAFNEFKTIFKKIK